MSLASFPQIGARFNEKDHTTVMSSVRKVAKLRVDDLEVAAALEAISLKLGFAARCWTRRSGPRSTPRDDFRGKLGDPRPVDNPLGTLRVLPW